MFAFVFLLILFSLANCDISEVHSYVHETYAEVLNYHKSVHLFYQDWIGDSYGKANLTTEEQQYYDSLFMEHQDDRSSHDEVYSLISILNKNQPNEKIVNSIMVLFKDFHDELLEYLEDITKHIDSKDADSYSRRKRQAGDETAKLLDLMSQLGNLGHLSKLERRAVRRPIRQAIFALGKKLWRKFLILRRRNRRTRLNGSPDNQPIAPPPSPDSNEPPTGPGVIAAPPPPIEVPSNEPPTGPGVIAAPPPPEKQPVLPDENIPVANRSLEDKLIDKLIAPPPPGESNAPPQSPVNIAAPPPVPPVLAAPPPITEEPVQADENIPQENPEVEETLIKRRKKRSIEDDLRDDFFSATSENRKLFEASLKWLMTEKPAGSTGLTYYDIFVMKHRMAEYPQAYSKEDNFALHSKFLNRFEHALQEFNQTVKLPYIDVCKLIQRPVSETVKQLQSVMGLFDGKVVNDCTWIGKDLKRSPSFSSISLKKLDEALHCSNPSVAVKSFGMDEYAALHSLFGPCVEGGSHMACPTCAVSDPIFWLLYADIERVLLREIS